MSQEIDAKTEDTFLIANSEAKIGKSYYSVHKYIRYGVEKDGRKIFLQSIDLPGGLGTSVEAYYRFVEEMNRRPHQADDVHAEESTNDASTTRNSDG